MSISISPPPGIEPGEVALGDIIRTPAGDVASVWSRETGFSTWVMLGVTRANGRHEHWSYGPDERIELVACTLSGHAA